MSLPHVEIGQPLEGQEQRNPWGWVLVFSILGLMLFVALAGYFSPERAAETIKSQAEVKLKSAVMFSEISNDVGGAPTDQLEQAATELRPYLAKDEEAALLYGEIRTEMKEPIAASDLRVLQRGKGAVAPIAYEALTSPKLDEQRARHLAAQIPKTKFTYKLLAAQTLEKGGITDGRAQLLGGNAVLRMLLLGGGILGACGLGMVLLFAYVAARSSHRLEPEGIPLAELTPADADRLAVRCGQFFALFLGAQLFVGFAARAGLTDRDWADVPVYLIIIAGIFAISTVPVGGKWISLRSLGVRSEHVGRDILWGLGAAAANAPIIALVAVVSNFLFKNLPQAEHPVSFEIQGTGSTWVIIKLVVVACIFAPFIEEILFRATLFPALNGVLQRVIAAGAVSSLLFGMIHPTGIPAWLPLATIGGMSCFLTYQTRSIVPSMVMHGVHNFVTLIFSLALFR